MNIPREERQAIEGRINQIAKENKGKITPELVVLDAADKDSPLHRWIEWDDPTAAAKYRLVQARRLIASVRIEVTIQDIKVQSIGYVRDPSVPADTQGYTSITRLRGKKAQALQALRYECIRAKAAMDRATEVAHILGLSSHVNSIMEELDSLIDYEAEED